MIQDEGAETTDNSVDIVSVVVEAKLNEGDIPQAIQMLYEKVGEWKVLKADLDSTDKVITVMRERLAVHGVLLTLSGYDSLQRVKTIQDVVPGAQINKNQYEGVIAEPDIAEFDLEELGEDQLEESASLNPPQQVDRRPAKAIREEALGYTRPDTEITEFFDGAQGSLASAIDRGFKRADQMAKGG